ncbi:unnamed protein product [Pleuronectes platessa]|uniref:Uncharacterized protein n=1 Tax=Pleuronectes platessa TaxID=8262 RepID=A0A9N7THX3_PLEPL|nr:unnamed protein product [Pleuronectes platessa]
MAAARAKGSHGAPAAMLRLDLCGGTGGQSSGTPTAPPEKRFKNPDSQKLQDRVSGRTRILQLQAPDDPDPHRVTELPQTRCRLAAPGSAQWSLPASAATRGFSPPLLRVLTDPVRTEPSELNLSRRRCSAGKTRRLRSFVWTDNLKVDRHSGGGRTVEQDRHSGGGQTQWGWTDNLKVDGQNGSGTVDVDRHSGGHVLQPEDARPPQRVFCAVELEMRAGASPLRLSSN